ncbi:MAG: tyrosine-type recombinase/integrase [Candidatus Hodarchaeota archaeon]
MQSNDRIKQRYFDELEQNVQAGLARRSTLAQRRKAVNYFLQFLNMNKINLKGLNSLHIQEFLHFLSNKRTSPGRKLAPATLKQIYALAKSFYVRCYERNFVSKHVDLIFIRNILHRYKLGVQKLPKYIDQENMKQLLTFCPDKWKALLHFMYDTGARISEVLAVQQQHLDLTNNRVQIFEPKTMNVRVTTLSNLTIQLLKEYLSKHRPEPRAGYQKFVFINQQRRQMSPRAVQYIVKQLSRKILGEKSTITPHYFRAACAVHLLESRVDIRQVQEIIGWKSLTVVQNYTRVTPQKQAQLKRQHHPGFQMQAPADEDQTLIKNQINDSFHHQIIEVQQKHQKELEELRKSFQQEQIKHEQERQAYETRIDELRKTQQQLIQILSQKSSE